MPPSASPSVTATRAPAASARQLYLFGPGIDLTVIAGGLTFILFPLALMFASQLSVSAFLVLLFVCNYPHYMATNYRIYRNRSQIERYKIFSIYITGLLALTAMIGHLMPAVWVKILYTIYFTWSPYHYSGQNYGIALMYLRRSAVEPSQRERHLLYTTFICCFLIYVASINADSGMAAVFPFQAIGIPRDIVRILYVAFLAVAIACGTGFLWRVVPRAPRQALTPVLLLMGSQFAWFAAATGVPLFSKELGLQALPIDALFPTIAFLHCAQYLGVTAYYAKRDDAAAHRAFSFWRYFAALIVGGVFLWIGTTRVLSEVFSLDYGISFLIMLSLINIHHFLMDGAIWKLRDGRLAQLLIAPAAPTREPSASATAAAMSARQRRKTRHAERESAPAAPGRVVQPPAQWWRTPAWAVACLLALALAGTDIYYRIGILRAGEISRTGNAQAAVSLYNSIWGFNPRVSEALDGLGFWSLRAGKIDDAVQQWSHSLALNPTETSVYAHIGLGEAYLRMGRVDDAIHHLELARQMRPEEQSSYVLLSSAYERRGDHAKAEAIRAEAARVMPAGAKAPRVFY